MIETLWKKNRSEFVLTYDCDPHERGMLRLLKVAGLCVTSLQIHFIPVTSCQTKQSCDCLVHKYVLSSAIDIHVDRHDLFSQPQTYNRSPATQTISLQFSFDIIIYILVECCAVILLQKRLAGHTSFPVYRRWDWGNKWGYGHPPPSQKNRELQCANEQVTTVVTGLFSPLLIPLLSRFELIAGLQKHFGIILYWTLGR